MAVAWKEDIKTSDLVGACCINMLMVTLAIADYSADLWVAAAASYDEQARLNFLVQYTAWRSDMPIVGKMLLILLLLLPVALFGIVGGAMQSILGWRKATAARHALDCTEAVTLSIIFFNVLARVPGITEAFLSACPAKKSGQQAQCTAALTGLTDLHLVLVGLNLIMFLCPILKCSKAASSEQAIRAKKD